LCDDLYDDANVHAREFFFADFVLRLTCAFAECMLVPLANRERVFM